MTIQMNDHSIQLWNAAHRGNEKRVADLIQSGVDVNQVSAMNEPALHRAVTNLAITTLLLNAGANPNAPGPLKSTAIVRAVDLCQHDVTEVLIKRGTDLNQKGYGGLTPFHCIAGNSTPHNIKLALRYGADINFQNDFGESPLMYAVDHFNKTNVQALVNAGADVKLKDKNGRTAAMRARENGAIEIAEILEAAEKR
jgi:ankyrin repeat protein